MHICDNLRQQPQALVFCGTTIPFLTNKEGDWVSKQGSDGLRTCVICCCLAIVLATKINYYADFWVSFLPWPKITRRKLFCNRKLYILSVISIRDLKVWTNIHQNTRVPWTNLWITNKDKQKRFLAKTNIFGSFVLQNAH